jgi:hypothetical protein
MMTDDARALNWSEATALHDSQLAFERLTVPREVLNDEIAALPCPHDERTQHQPEQR